MSQTDKRMSEKYKQQFIALFDGYHKDIYRFLRIRVANNEMAEDLASEAFARAWEHISRNEAAYPDNPRAYLYKIARNCLADHYRSAKSGEVPMDDSFLQSIDKNAKNDNMGASLDGVDIVQIMRVHAVLSRMDPREAELVTLRYVDDFSHREIAEIVGKSEGAVRTALHRAMANLRKLV